MAQFETIKENTVPTEVKKPVKAAQVRYVDASTKTSDVLSWDSSGDKLLFEHDKGKFLELTDEEIRSLGIENRTRYGISLNASRKSNPENDELQRRLKITGINSRRSEFEKQVRNTDQGALATKKLQAYVGDGFKYRWCRPDRLEERLDKGYKIVEAPADGKPSGEVLVGVKPTEGHFEVRSEPQKPELVLMRIPVEKKAEIDRVREAKAMRFQEIVAKSGEQKIRDLGGQTVPEKAQVVWQDR